MKAGAFFAIWAGSIAVTAAVVGWSFLVQTFGLPDAAAVALGAGVPLTVIATAMWWAVVR